MAIFASKPGDHSIQAACGRLKRVSAGTALRKPDRATAPLSCAPPAAANPKPADVVENPLIETLNCQDPRDPDLKISDVSLLSVGAKKGGGQQ
jgi:hypothetical protein